MQYLQTIQTAELTAIIGVPPIGASHEEKEQAREPVWLLYLLGQVTLPQWYPRSVLHKVGVKNKAEFGFMHTAESGGKPV